MLGGMGASAPIGLDGHGRRRAVSHSVDLRTTDSTSAHTERAERKPMTLRPTSFASIALLLGACAGADTSVPGASVPGVELPGVPEAPGLGFDADGDGLTDRLEGAAAGVDTDLDGIPDYLDHDSDDDGILDRVEGFVDLDDDGVPSFRDLDADGDHLGDAEELLAATDPEVVDTDGDGVDDFVEVMGCEDAGCAGEALDPEASPLDRDLPIVVSPPGEEPTLVGEPVAVFDQLSPLFADFYFLLEHGAHSKPLFDAMREDRLILWSELDGWFPESAQAGVGFVSERGFEHAKGIGSVGTALGVFDVEALYRLPEESGEVRLDEALEAVLHAAPNDERCARGFGEACFRGGSLPIVVIVLDTPPTPDAEDGPKLELLAESAAERGVLLLGIDVSPEGKAADALKALARDSGSVDARGELVVHAEPAKVVAALSLLLERVQQMAMDVRGRLALDDRGDASGLYGTVEGLEGCLEAEMLLDSGEAETRSAIRVGGATRGACFELLPRRHPFEVEQTQRLHGDIEIVTGEDTLVGRSPVLFLVPAY